MQVAAPPGCEPAARQFYGGLLGLPEIEKPEPLRERGGVWFGVGALQRERPPKPPIEGARTVQLEVHFSHIPGLLRGWPRCRPG